MFTKKALAATAAAKPIYIEDTFSTYLYTGNGSTQTITNGIDLAGEGGLVWIKFRSGTLSDVQHALYDTQRGANKTLQTNGGQGELTTTDTLTSFGSSGFTLGADVTYGTVNYNSSQNYASWTFRKAEKFFDVVTYTGNGSNRTISHNLGSVPGCIIIKPTSYSDNWTVYHRSTGITSKLYLNSTSATIGAGAEFNSTNPTSTVFSVGTDFSTNGSGQTYVAYLFAHDAGGFGDSGSDSVVKCGTYAGNGSTSGPTIDLGWEPQWLLIKKSNGPGNWFLMDNMRGLSASATVYLEAQNSGAESGAVDDIILRPTGFQLTSNSSSLNGFGDYIYIAIRRGPMKTPTSGTEVFGANAYTGNGTTGRLIGTITTDLVVMASRTSSNYGDKFFLDRLRGATAGNLGSTQTGAESNWNFDTVRFDQNNALALGADTAGLVNILGTTFILHNFRRAPGFFDVVAYTGTGANRTVSHNLGVVPELMIVKNRATTGGFGPEPWGVYAAPVGNTKFLYLHSNTAAITASSAWNDTTPSATVFTVGTAGITNVSGFTYIAYLFATCPGVSKVGSYTGTGTTLDIDCGFTAGARFVLIKRTDSTGDWFVWDTARGIISGDDPYLLLNSTAAEVTNTDYIDPLSSGFQISSTAPAAINASGGSFIFLAIA
jgi:hypothetical protein